MGLTEKHRVKVRYLRTDNVVEHGVYVDPEDGAICLETGVMVWMNGKKGYYLRIGEEGRKDIYGAFVIEEIIPPKLVTKDLPVGTWLRSIDSDMIKTDDERWLTWRDGYVDNRKVQEYIDYGEWEEVLR